MSQLFGRQLFQFHHDSIFRLCIVFPPFFSSFLMLVLRGAFALLLAPNALGQNGGAGESRASTVRVNDSIVYHGKIVNPSGTPLEGSVVVQIKIFSPEPSVCLLWSEQQTIKVKNGGFSMELGYAENRIAGPNGGVAQDFRSVFINHKGLTHKSATCFVGSSYTPSKNDDRLMSAEFVDGGVAVAVEKIPIKSVPFAKQAAEVGGFEVSNLFKISGVGSEEQFSPEEVSRLKIVSASGSANQILGVSGTGGVVEYKSITAGTGIAVTHTSVGIQISATGGGGNGSVTNVGVSGLPLSVINSSSSPTISIAQANGLQAGYLSAADWSAFNSKQPAGSYLTSISGAQVTTALGFTPQVAGSYLTGIAGSDVMAALGYSPLNMIDTVIKGGQPGPLSFGSSDSTSVEIKSNNSTRLTITSDGKVGIGTQSPSAGLDVASSVTAGFQLSGRSAGGNSFPTNLVWKDVTKNSHYSLGHDNRGLYGAGNDDNLVMWQYDGTTYIERLLFTKDGGTVLGNIWGSPAWNQVITNHATRPGLNVTQHGAGNLLTLSSASVDRLVVNNVGNLGLGTSSPSDKLHVEGKIRAQEICDTSGANCKLISEGWAAGSVTNLGVSGLPLSVINSSSTPTISIAQANGSQAGYLSAADWSAFNSKQPAGSYLTSISGAQVITALGFTPQVAGSYLTGIVGSDVVSALGYTPQSQLSYSPLSSSLPANQTLIGNGSNVATPGFFGVGQLRNATGTAQFPASCSTSQTLTWSSVTDVFSCTNIGSLPASAIASGTIDSARLPFGASLWQDAGSGNIRYGGGNVGIGTMNPLSLFHVSGDGGSAIQVFDTFRSDGFGSVIYARAARGLASAPIASQLNDQIASYVGFAHNGTNFGNAAALIFTADGPQTTTSSPGAITLSTVPAGSTSLVERMKITAAGQVGIGTNSPGQMLTVSGTIESTAGGFKFPDGTTQSTAATGAGIAGPSFLAHRNNVDQSVSAAVWTKVNLTTESFDSNNNFDSSLNSRFTPTVAGKYLILGNVYCSGASVYCYVGINKNGNQVAASGVSTALTAPVPSTSVILDMNGVSDYVELWALTQGTSISGSSTQTFLSGSLLAPLAAGSVAGTGATNYVPVWTNSSSLTNSPIAVAASNVGIGTISPTEKLDVSGRVRSSNAIINSGVAGSMVIRTDAIPNYPVPTIYSMNGVGAAHTLLINPEGGNVGIGTTTPTAKLEVAGVVHSTSGGIKFPDGTTQTTAASGSGGGSFGAWSSRSADTVYQATTDGFIVVNPSYGGSGYGYFSVFSDGSNPPTTERIKGKRYDSGGSQAGATIPVRKNDYWKVTTTYGNAPEAIYWMPVGN